MKHDYRKRRHCICTFLILGILAWFCFPLPGQTGGSKYLKNYSRKDYLKSTPQNWWVSQDPRGVIWVGNHGGLLEYDGASWRSVNVPNKNVRSLAIADDGTVYVGGNHEFGFLEADAHGLLEYVSLSDRLPQDRRDFRTVWKTYAAEAGVYFQAKEMLFRWTDGQIKTWRPTKKFHFSYLCNGVFYILEESAGLLRMENGELTPVPGGEMFAGRRIYMMAPYDDKRLLIGARSHGLFLFDGVTAPRPFPTEADDYLKKNRLYHGIRLSSGDFALATLSGGLVILHADGRLKETLTTTDGLPEDNVKYVFEDSQGNVWLALNAGLSHIELHSPLSIYDNRAGLPGLVLSVTHYDDILYAGTDKGLYKLDSSNRFQPVPGISGNCWSLLSTGPSLLAATSGGLFQVAAGRIRLLVKRRSYVLAASRRNPNRVWANIDAELVSLIRREDLWAEEHRFSNIQRDIKSIVEDGSGSLWLGARSKGVIKVGFDEGRPPAQPEVTEYADGQGLPAGEINVFIAAGHVMAASIDKGIFRLDADGKRFVPDSTLGDEFSGGPKGNGVFRIVEDDDGNIWFHSRSRNYHAEPRPGNTYHVIKKPFLRVPVNQVNTIYPDPAGAVVWFAGHDGLIRFDTTVKKDYDQPFSTLVRWVKSGEHLLFGGIGHDGAAGEPLPRVLEYKSRNLRFWYTATFFEETGRTKYRYFLEGFDEGWSDLTSNAVKEYTNLDSGSYVFRVRARNIYGNTGKEALYRFRILPPWYITWWMILFYLLVLFLLVFLVVRWRSGKLEREKQRLERVVEERTTEINHKNRQLEKQTLQLKEQSGKLQDMAKVKARFFANISHEFRTPLTLILGPLEQMSSGAADPRQKERYGLMTRNAQRLLTLINQLLDLSRFDSGKMKLQAARHDVTAFVKGITASFQLLAEQKKVRLLFDAGETPVLLYFDPGKLEEVLDNLLSNAFKFTPAGGSITVAVAPVHRGGEEGDGAGSGFVDISVRDTGPGISGEQLAHIFDRFYQAEGLTGDAQEHHHKGTGIGLALAKELVALHHGAIDVHSREGKGTEFIVRLPLGAAHLKPDEIVETAEPAAPSPPHKKTGQFPSLGRPPEQERRGMENGDMESGSMEAGGRGNGGEPAAKNVILVVEDNADVRTYIKGALEPAYTIHEAVNGREGIDTAKKLIPDLIVSDVMMPETDGYTLCRTLKKDVNTSHIPIILLTAKAEEDSIVEGLETGADDYITKPFSTKILCTRIKNLIDLRLQLQQKVKRQMMLQPAEINVSSIDETFLKEAQAAIEKNLSESEFNVEQLGKALYMSRASLYRKVQALTGDSPREFIRSYRLKRSAQLLRKNFGNVTEVAFEVGFSSTSYFIKCFKETFQQSPHAYQETYKTST